MNKKISFPIAIIIIVACAVLVGVIVVWQYGLFPEISWEEFPLPRKPVKYGVYIPILASLETVNITTDQTEYRPEEMIKIIVENNSDERICFESCNPHHLEKKNDSWDWIIFLLCEENWISECIERKSTKTFEQETTGYTLTSGLYRIAVPICIECRDLIMDHEYRIDQTIYSNEFTIK